MPDCLGPMTKLTHTESGQWQASLAVVPLPKADPQGMGSAITYARRYAITAMLGMATEDDDCRHWQHPAQQGSFGARRLLGCSPLFGQDFRVLRSRLL